MANLRRCQEFVDGIASFLTAKDATSLGQYLLVEPPFGGSSAYADMAQELQSGMDSSALIQRLEATTGEAWPGFSSFLQNYFDFFKSVNYEDLLGTHTQLTAVVNACITALGNPTNGILVLPTCINLCGAVAKLAMTLDKRPDLTRHLHKGDDEGQKSLVETTAECIQRAFTICLTERTASGSGVLDGQPAGKKIGIYSFANLVLKLLFRCRKTSLAEQLFTNINQNSPPLALYPAAQRVTYLYYLGRFYLANTHYYKAQQCLQEAFKQCHRQCASQRKEILTYLVACNLILGRCPTPALMKYPECAEVLQLFAPLSIAIRKGDICAFKKFLGPENPHYTYLFNKGLLLPLLYRAEVLVWRNLARRVFILTYEVPTDPNSRKAPTLSIHDLLTAAKLCQHRLEASPNPLEKRKLKPSMGVIYGNLQPTLADMEAVVAALVAQDLLHGYVSHNLKRFAILGSKLKGGPLLAGFPIPWRVIQRRALDGVGADSAEVDVTGWVTKEAGGFKGGVVNLTGIARPVGV